jgi:hypothetical protein
LWHFAALLLAVSLVGCNGLVSTNEGMPLASTNQGIPPASTNEGMPPAIPPTPPASSNQGLSPASSNQALPPASTNQGLPSTNEGVPELAPDPSYRDVIAKHLKTTFKNYSSYEAFEISNPRWVHSFQGWTWLVCVRFQAQGHKRTYALFVSGSNIVDARYAVNTDECGTQAYALFEQMGGSGLDPLH